MGLTAPLDDDVTSHRHIARDPVTSHREAPGRLLRERSSCWGWQTLAVQPAVCSGKKRLETLARQSGPARRAAPRIPVARRQRPCRSHKERFVDRGQQTGDRAALVLQLLKGVLSIHDSSPARVLSLKLSGPMAPEKLSQKGRAAGKRHEAVRRLPFHFLRALRAHSADGRFSLRWLLSIGNLEWPRQSYLGISRSDSQVIHASSFPRRKSSFRSPCARVPLCASQNSPPCALLSCT